MLIFIEDFFIYKSEPRKKAIGFKNYSKNQNYLKSLQKPLKIIFFMNNPFL